MISEPDEYSVLTHDPNTRALPHRMPPRRSVLLALLGLAAGGGSGAAAVLASKPTEGPTLGWSCQFWRAERLWPCSPWPYAMLAGRRAR